MTFGCMPIKKDFWSNLAEDRIQSTRNQTNFRATGNCLCPTNFQKHVVPRKLIEYIETIL